MKKVLVFLMSIVITIASVVIPRDHMTQVMAAATEQEEAYQLDGYLTDKNGHQELSTGDIAYAETSVVRADGTVLDSDMWEFCSDYEVSVSLREVGESGSVNFYSSYEIPYGDDIVWFTGEIPDEAFGKYVYKMVITLVHENDEIIAVGDCLRTVNTVTSFGDTSYLTFSRNNVKRSVSVYSIWDCGVANIPSEVTIGGNAYQVIAIGNNALEDKKITALTLPASVISIDKSAFEGAAKLKTVTIQGDLQEIGKDAFKGINKNVTFKIKASKAKYDKIVKLIKKAGAPKTAKYKRITK